MTDDRKPINLDALREELQAEADQADQWNARLHGIVELVGADNLVEISGHVRAATGFHPEAPEDEPCFCPAVMAIAQLYEHGFGIMHVDHIKRAAPILMQQDADRERARNN